MCVCITMCRWVRLWLCLWLRLVVYGFVCLFSPSPPAATVFYEDFTEEITVAMKIAMSLDCLCVCCAVLSWLCFPALPCLCCAVRVVLPLRPPLPHHQLSPLIVRLLLRNGGDHGGVSACAIYIYIIYQIHRRKSRNKAEAHTSRSIRQAGHGIQGTHKVGQFPCSNMGTPKRETRRMRQSMMRRAYQAHGRHMKNIANKPVRFYTGILIAEHEQDRTMQHTRTQPR